MPMKTRFGSAGKRTRSVLCPECGQTVDVAAKAMSIFCPHCSKRVILEDYTVKGFHASRDFATAGNIVVERRGTVSAPIKARNLLVKGDVKGSVLVRGSVEVTRTGQLRGDVTAPSLLVRQGGSYEGFCRIGTEEPAVATLPTGRCSIGPT